MKNIEEYNISINTDEKGEAIHRTIKINGSLKAIIVFAPTFFNGELLVYVKDVPSFQILKVPSLNGFKIYLPKIMNCDENGQLLNIQSTHYSEIPLNDELEIKITNGMANSKIDITLRWE